MRFFFLFFLCLISSIIFSCKNDYIVEKHILGNGVKVISKSHKDSINIQNVTVYYPNGVLEKKFRLINDKENGKETTFFESSNIKSEYNYIDGELTGIQKEYFDSRQNHLKKISNYESDRYLGNQYEFYKNRKIKRHYIVNPKNQICNQVNYKINGEQIKILSSKFNFGEFDKKNYNLNDTINYRTFIFTPKNYEVKYSSSFNLQGITSELKTKEITENIVKQKFNLLKSENYVLEERIEIKDLINDTVFSENYKLIITPNVNFY